MLSWINSNKIYDGNCINTINNINRNNIMLDVLGSSKNNKWTISNK